MLLNRDNLVWVGHRTGFAPDKGWQMPQGGIDKCEIPETAARRELFEETSVRSLSLLHAHSDWINYDLPDHLIGKAFQGKFKGQKQLWFAYRFEGQDEQINVLDPGDGDPSEFDDWKWVQMQELIELIVPFKRQLYTEVVTAFTHLQR